MKGAVLEVVRPVRRLLHAQEREEAVRARKVAEMPMVGGPQGHLRPFQMLAHGPQLLCLWTGRIHWSVWSCLAWSSWHPAPASQVTAMGKQCLRPQFLSSTVIMWEVVLSSCEPKRSRRACRAGWPEAEDAPGLFQAAGRGAHFTPYHEQRRFQEPLSRPASSRAELVDCPAAKILGQ